MASKPCFRASSIAPCSSNNKPGRAILSRLRLAFPEGSSRKEAVRPLVWRISRCSLISTAGGTYLASSSRSASRCNSIGILVFPETLTVPLLAFIAWSVLRLAHRKPEGNRRRHQPLTEDFLFLVGHFEKLRTRTQQALGASQHEEPGRIQCIVKDRYYPFLQMIDLSKSLHCGN